MIKLLILAKRSATRIKENEPKIFGDDTICESVAVQQCTDMQQYSLHLNDPSVRIMDLKILAMFF